METIKLAELYVMGYVLLTGAPDVLIGAVKPASDNKIGLFSFAFSFQKWKAAAFQLHEQTLYVLINLCIE